MGRIADIFVKQARQLYPNGRAWKLPFGGTLEKLHKGLARSDERLIAAANSLKDSSLPHNANFDEGDAVVMEAWLGLTVSPGVDLAMRVKAIIRKLNFPGTIRPRQNWRYMQAQLQKAGFNVYVYENRFDDGSGGFVTMTPADVLGIPIGSATLGSFDLGEADLGESWATAGISLVANSISAEIDAHFAIGSNYRSTFYISSDVIDVFAEVDARREAEFRKLIHQCKPNQAVGFLFVNYV
jgi:hypothetical protein